MRTGRVRLSVNATDEFLLHTDRTRRTTSTLARMLPAACSLSRGRAYRRYVHVAGTCDARQICEGQSDHAHISHEASVNLTGNQVKQGWKYPRMSWRMRRPFSVQVKGPGPRMPLVGRRSTFNGSSPVSPTEEQHESSAVVLVPMSAAMHADLRTPRISTLPHRLGGGGAHGHQSSWPPQRGRLHLETPGLPS